MEVHRWTLSTCLLLLLGNFGACDAKGEDETTCYKWCDAQGNWGPTPKPKTEYDFWWICLLGCAGSSGTDDMQQDVQRTKKLLACNGGCVDLCHDDCKGKFDTFTEDSILGTVCYFYCQTGDTPGKLTDKDYKKLATRFKPTTCDAFCDGWCPTFKLDPTPEKDYTCTDICKAGCPGSAGGGGEPADVGRAEKLLHACNASCFDSCHDDCFNKFKPADVNNLDDWHSFDVCMYYCETGDEPGKLADKDKAMVEERLKPTCATFCRSQKSHELNPKPKNEYQFLEVCNHGCAGSSGKDNNIHDDAKRAEKMLSCDAGCFDSCHDDCKSKFTQFDKDPIVKDVCLFYCQTGDTPGKLTDADNKKLATRFKPTTCDAFCNGWCSSFNLDPPPKKNDYQCSSPCKVGCPGSACVTDGGGGPTGESADVARAERLLHACNGNCYDRCYDKCHEKFKAAVDKNNMDPFNSCLYHCQTGTKAGILTYGEYNLIKAKFNA